MPMGIPGTGWFSSLSSPGTNSACLADLEIPLVHLASRSVNLFFFFFEGFCFGVLVIIF